ERVRAGQVALIAPEDLGEHGLCRVLEVRVTSVSIGILKLVLRLRDAARDLADSEAVGVGVELLDESLDQRARVARVIDREALAVAQRLRLATQDAHARRVEGRDPHAL